MLFPALVILPGMIAAALAVTHKDGYRLPPKPLDSAIYRSHAPAVDQASDAGLQGTPALQPSTTPSARPTPRLTSSIRTRSPPWSADNKTAALPEGKLKDRLQDAVPRTITTASSSRWSRSIVRPACWVWR